MRKRFLTMLLGASIFLGMCFPIQTFAIETDVVVEETISEVASGVCGENVSWILDSQGVLTIYGEGMMTDWENWYGYTTKDAPPWFAYKDSILQLSIEEGVTTIGVDAFYGCTALQSVKIPESVTKIGYEAFGLCSSLTEVTLPQSVTELEYGVFLGCSNLHTVNLSEQLTSIGEYAFFMCERLVNIMIPESVTYIGEYAFCFCSELTEIIIPNGVNEILEYTFYFCENLENVMFSDGTIHIGESAFAYCEKLRNVALTEGIFTIGADAFYGCKGLSVVDIPESVTWIGSGAFAECTGLQKIYFNGIAPIIGEGDGAGYEGAFSNVTATVVYHSYKNGWRDGVVNKNYGGTLTWFEIATPFMDLDEDAWYYKTIKNVFLFGFMTGTSDMTFEPESPMSRAMVVSVLYRIAGRPTTTYQQMFVDVIPGQWYSTTVTWAVEQKIVNGFADDNTFRPNDNITREQVAVIIRNYVKSIGIDTTTTMDVTTFKDYNKISSWAKSAIAWAVENGIMSGTQEGTLRPQGNATRAECAKMLLKAYEMIEECKN